MRIYQCHHYYPKKTKVGRSSNLKNVYPLNKFNNNLEDKVNENFLVIRNIFTVEQSHYHKNDRGIGKYFISID